MSLVCGAFRKLCRKAYCSQVFTKTYERVLTSSSDVIKDIPEEFNMSKRGNFFQEPPVIRNSFKDDHFLQRCLKRMLPTDVCTDVFNDLSSFGNRISDEIDHLGRTAELEPPTLRSYDAWGKRIDEIITCQAWKDLHCVSAEEGLVSLAYERSHKQWSRLHQMVKLYLFAPSSGLYSCPLAMTDGAAKLIEISGDDFIRNRAFSHLISRDPKQFWTSGQWMTEREGGSDVGGGTNTIAKGPFSNKHFDLYGYKWFSSASDANVVFTLARIIDEEGLITKGSQGLSLFYLETKDINGNLNNMEIQRLKNKLGTRQLPTAEVLLDGTQGYLVGERGRGIANISPMLTITRLHNSISATGIMRRMMQLCSDFASKRVTFGKYLSRHPLHMQTLAKMELQTRGCTLLVLEVCRMLGFWECGESTSHEAILLRILTPLLKLYTAKQAIQVASEGLEAFGGQGYIEDTGLPTMLRDAQVLSIWEGTTNVLSLDIIKFFLKHQVEVKQSITGALLFFLKNANIHDLEVQASYLKKQLDHLTEFAEAAAINDPTILYTAARDFAFSLAHIYIGSLLVYHASSETSTPCDIAAASRWCCQPITMLNSNSYNGQEVEKDYTLVMNTKSKN